ncbi:MAG: phage portal protein, partial [Dehalococcoidia bacterium]|nr:phage portal protein [Dehalococcoidia bacterium]
MILRSLFERPWSERRAVTIKDVLGESFDLGPSDSGEIVTTDTAMRVAAVFACVRVIAATCGSLPLHVYRERNGVRERIELPNERHIWDQPNPEMTRTWFWETVFAHLVLTGNAYITPVYD